MDKFKFNNGDSMPAISFGTWRMVPEWLEATVPEVLKSNYPGIDTAQYYTNEGTIGNLIKGSNIFVTTKIAPDNYNTKEQFEAAMNNSLKKLHRDPVDLLLLHFPSDDKTTVEGWKYMLEAKKQGRAKHIGVSNHGIRHLKLQHEATGVWPEVNQVCFNIFDQQKEMRAFCKEKGIIVTGYQTMAVLFDSYTGYDFTDEQTKYLESLASKYNKSVPQVLLRHALDSGVTILPKTKTPSRVAQNIDIFDFKLSKEELDTLAKWDKHLTNDERVRKAATGPFMHSLEDETDRTKNSYYKLMK